VNLFDAQSIVENLGLIGVLVIIFAETGLLIGLAFPGDSLLFIAGFAASGLAPEIFKGASLDPVLLFVLSPIAAIFGSAVGYWFGEKYGKKLFDKPDGRVFNHRKVAATEKWLTKYGIGKALVLARFVPFVRTLINPMCGIIGVPKKTFMIWNSVGALIWTQGVIGLGYLLGNILENSDIVKGSVDKYLLPVIGLIVFVSLVPVLIEFFKERQSKRFKP